MERNRTTRNNYRGCIYKVITGFLKKCRIFLHAANMEAKVIGCKYMEEGDSKLERTVNKDRCSSRNENKKCTRDKNAILVIIIMTRLI